MMTFKKQLFGKRILITGGSRGLGAAFCECFAQEGAKVAFNYGSDQTGAQKTLSQMAAYDTPTLAFQVSVLDSKGLTQMVKEIESAWGGIDILVNNAGISQPLPLALIEEADWDQVMDINVKGYFITTRAVVRGMIRRKQGHILNISSLAGVRMLEAPLHYSASKAAIRGFTEALCKEVGRYNIQVNCLAPGLLEEGLGHNLPEHRLRDYLEHVALGRTGTLAEVAKFAAFVVSDRNRYMNGATLVMDGGL